MPIWWNIIQILEIFSDEKALAVPYFRHLYILMFTLIQCRQENESSRYTLMLNLTQDRQKILVSTSPHPKSAFPSGKSDLLKPKSSPFPAEERRMKQHPSSLLVSAPCDAKRLRPGGVSQPSRQEQASQSCVGNVICLLRSTFGFASDISEGSK